MADLKFVDQHNMVAYLEKTKENSEFHQIVVVISESSVRSDLLFNDEDDIACLTNDEIFDNLALMGYEQPSTKLTFQKDAFNDTYETPTHSKKVFSNMARKSKNVSGKVTPLFDSMLVQNQEPKGEDHEVDEVVHKEGGDSVERAITTDPSLVAAQDSDNTIRTQTTAMPNVDIPQGMDTDGSPRRQETMGGALAQTRSERVLEKPNEPPLPEGHTSGSEEGNMELTFELIDTIPPTPYDSPLTGGYTPGSDEGRLKLKELMAICTKLSKQVLDLEKKKDAQVVEILKLKQRVKKLERKRKSSISHPRRRIYRQVESSDDDLDEEDASK
ncbi:hypothetical protein Tco_1100260 [Tanacetum coccineum]